MGSKAAIPDDLRLGSIGKIGHKPIPSDRSGNAALLLGIIEEESPDEFFMAEIKKHWAGRPYARS